MSVLYGAQEKIKTHLNVNQSTKVKNKNKHVLPNARYTITVRGFVHDTVVLKYQEQRGLLLLHF